MVAGHVASTVTRALDRPVTRSLWTWALLGVAGSTGLAITGSQVGAIPDPGHDRWWFTVGSGHSSLLTATFYASAVFLTLAWVGVGVFAHRGVLTSRRAWVLLAAWAVPLLIGPPLFSRDVYSYIGQGMLIRHGLNPYHVGPAVLGPSALLGSIASAWRNTPAPYGPLFLMLTGLMTRVFGDTLVAEVLAMRVLELAGVALMMVYLPRIARRLGADPGMALWLGVLSPLALFSFVASGHNDALMIGLLCAGVAEALENRPALGIFLCALAMAVKIPAVAAIVFLTATEMVGAPRRRQVVAVIRAGAITVATAVVATLLSGLGWAWLSRSALQIPTELRTLSTPTVSLGVGVSHLLHAVGIAADQRSVVSAVQAVFALAAVAAGLWLLFQVRRFDPVRLLALAFVVVVLASPTLWPWYLMWGIALLAATPAQSSNIVAAGAALAMLLVGPSGTPVLQGNDYLLMVLASVAGAAWLLYHHRWMVVVSGRLA